MSGRTTNVLPLMTQRIFLPSGYSMNPPKRLKVTVQSRDTNSFTRMMAMNGCIMNGEVVNGPVWLSMLDMHFTTSGNQGT